MKTKPLCEHVILAKDGDILLVDGPGVPVFAWSRELEADVPQLKCSVCSRRVPRILGLAVRRASLR